MAKYRIISDGTSQETKVLDPEGNELPNVTFIRWEISGGGIAKAMFEVYGVEVDVIGEE